MQGFRVRGLGASGFGFILGFGFEGVGVSGLGAPVQRSKVAGGLTTAFPLRHSARSCKTVGKLTPNNLPFEGRI